MRSKLFTGYFKDLLILKARNPSAWFLFLFLTKLIRTQSFVPITKNEHLTKTLQKNSKTYFIPALTGSMCVLCTTEFQERNNSTNHNPREGAQGMAKLKCCFWLKKLLGWLVEQSPLQRPCLVENFLKAMKYWGM